ncbi:hypothetical protein BKA59DRAFT_524143 [Fusarium tricinctum]|jgi:hypothetical protein|uniref:Uncharacterized protein n=1 Tax=Fusarium tricinctum TaxID=61284 RepID=A0A8K0RZ83_9HYPO|nr:hypothetical protein BKA59DRAFT_524143 [Fusarium tricinctum]
MSHSIPSYEERIRNNQYPASTDATKRLFWYIQGPLETNLFVLEDSSDPYGSRQPYAQQIRTNGISWHSVSSLPLTNPMISSINVCCSELEEWPENWASLVHQHANPDMETCIFGEVDGRRKLINCCGEDRPKHHEPLLVTVSSQLYVTIHDYVTAVHPWLVVKRD